MALWHHFLRVVPLYFFQTTEVVLRRVYKTDEILTLILSNAANALVANLPHITALCAMQMITKKRFVYKAIVFIWIIVPTYEITYVALTTDIVRGTCTWYPVYMSEISQIIVGIVNWFFAYFLPLVTMVFCYARVVYTLRTKVTALPLLRPKPKRY